MIHGVYRISIDVLHLNVVNWLVIERENLLVLLVHIHVPHTHILNHGFENMYCACTCILQRPLAGYV